MHITQKYVPIPPQPVKMPTAETPKNQTFNFRMPNTKEFQTPIDILNQNYQSYNPSQTEPFTVSTPVHKVQPKNTLIQELDLKKTLPERFSNKTYGNVDFENGARYEGEFNTQGEF